MKKFLLTVMINAIAFGAFAGKKEISLTVSKHLNGDLVAYINFAEVENDSALGYCISGIIDAKKTLIAQNYDWDKYSIFVRDDRTAGRIQVVFGSPLATQRLVNYSDNSFTHAYGSCERIISDVIKNHLNQKANEANGVGISGGTSRSSDVIVTVPQAGLK